MWKVIFFQGLFDKKKKAQKKTIYVNVKNVNKGFTDSFDKFTAYYLSIHFVQETKKKTDPRHLNGSAFQ